MKKLSLILAVLLIVPSLCIGASADEVWTYTYIINGREVTISSPEDIKDIIAFTAAYDFANYYIYGNTPPTDRSSSGAYYSSADYDGAVSHSFVRVTATTISHKYYSSAPRCIEYIYVIKICKDCGFKYKTLADQNRIYCCGEDSSPFDDVPHGAWYYDAVCACCSSGYMSGTSARRFSPNNKLTRAAFAVILSKIDGADLSSYSGRTGFKDVPAGEWYSKAINWANRHGYTYGIGGGLFGVNNSVTREQLAVFLYTYTKKKGYGISRLADLSRFTDKNSISSWALTGMRWAVGAGLISGTTSKTISPKKIANRAETAVIIKQYSIKIKK